MLTFQGGTSCVLFQSKEYKKRLISIQLKSMSCVIGKCLSSVLPWDERWQASCLSSTGMSISALIESFKAQINQLVTYTSLPGGILEFESFDQTLVLRFNIWHSKNTMILVACQSSELPWLPYASSAVHFGFSKRWGWRNLCRSLRVLN